LDALASYTPADAKEAEGILERVVPRLAHSNSGAVLSAVKVIMRYLDFLNSPELIRSYCRKLSAPLISLMNAEPEIVYVNLKNINLIL
jgi:AP-1 complex subunit beta-1